MGNSSAINTAKQQPATLMSELAFSTDQFAGRDQVCAWREIIGRSVCKVEIEPASVDGFASQARIRALPGLGVISATASALTYRRPSHLINNDDVILTVSAMGGEAEERGRAVQLGPGDATLLSAANTSMFHLPSGGRHSLRVPRKAIATAVSDIDDAVCRHISAQAPALRLLRCYVGALDDTRLETAELCRQVVTHVHDLFALTVGATRDGIEIAKARGVRAARLRAIKTDIERNLGQEGLSIATVAARHRLPARYVQRLFEQDGTTFTAFLLESRLARARRILTNPVLAHFKISAVAVEAGFPNLSYFNRAFRRRYGASPLDVRVRCRAIFDDAPTHI
jgi:AraC-like DNA-binding protein